MCVVDILFWVRVPVCRRGGREGEREGWSQSASLFLLVESPSPLPPSLPPSLPTLSEAIVETQPKVSIMPNFLTRTFSMAI